MSKPKNARRAIDAASYLLSPDKSWDEQRDDFFEAASDIRDWLENPARPPRGIVPPGVYVDEVSAFTSSGKGPEDGAQPPQGPPPAAAEAIATLTRSKKRLEKEKAARPDGKRWTVYGPDKVILDTEKKEFRLVIYKDEKTMEVLEERKDLTLKEAKRQGSESGANYLVPMKAMNLLYLAKTGYTSVGVVQPGQMNLVGTPSQVSAAEAINRYAPRVPDQLPSVQRSMRRGLQS